jgi:hypothetical protein
LEKEARLVVQEIWAKVSAREKLIVYGAIAVLVGWIVGEFIATVNLCGGASSILGISCPSFSYFAAGNAGSFAILGLVAAIATVVVLYLKVAPNMSITWPLPVVQIVLGLSAATLICGLLVVLMQLSYGLGDAPVTMWVADIIFIGGGALMAYAAYMEYTAGKVA